MHKAGEIFRKDIEGGCRREIKDKKKPRLTGALSYFFFLAAFLAAFLGADFFAAFLAAFFGAAFFATFFAMVFLVIKLFDTK
jgi:hypothetical protein